MVRCLHASAAAFRSRLVAREALYGAWSVIPSALSVRLLAAAGLDYVVIDLQHGGATEADLPGMTSAIRLAGATPIARVRMRTPPISGGLWTWAAKASSCRTSTRPPRPARWPARSATRRPGTGRRAACWPGRSRSAWSWRSRPVNSPIDATLAVNGVDGLSRSQGPVAVPGVCARPGRPGAEPGAGAGLGGLLRRGKPVGVHATDGVTARRYRGAGCTLITIADDAGAITRHTAAQLGLARA